MSEEEYFEWIFKKRKQFKSGHSIIGSLLHFLNLLEENIEYNVKDLNTVKFSDLPWQEAKIYLVKSLLIKEGKAVFIDDDENINKEYTRLIKNYMPDFKFIGDSTFKIINSPIYRRFDDVQKALIYLWNKIADNEKSAVPLPKRFQTPLFKKKIGHMYFYTPNKKRYYYKPEGGKIIAYLKHDLSELINEEKKIEDGINPYYGLSKEGSLIFKSEKVVAFLKKD